MARLKYARKEWPVVSVFSPMAAFSFLVVVFKRDYIEKILISQYIALTNMLLLDSI